MRPKSLSSFLIAALITTMVISLLPQSYAGTGPQSSQQPSQARPRRGKNGSRVSDPPARPPAERNDESDSSAGPPGEEPQPTTPGNEVAPAHADPRKADPPQADNRDDRQSSNATGQNTTQQRREPAPFDRPPIATGSQKGSTSRPSQPSREPAYTPSPDAQPSGRGRARNDRRPTTNDRQPTQYDPPPRRDPRPVPSSTGDIDDPQPDRSSKEPPVLRRPSESRPRSEERGRSSDPDSRSTDGSNQPPPDQDEPIKLNATLVNIPVLVSDRSGRYVPQLSEKDFLLFEDGVEQEVAFFGNEKVPFKVALLLDVSPSVQGNLQDIQDAALEFVRQLRAQDEVMVVSFDKNIHYLSDFTNDRRALEHAIRSINTGSGTSVYDAVYETVARRLRNVEGRKALILFSDGEDTTSRRASYDEAVDIVTESDVLVYGLRYPGTNNRQNPWPNTRNPIPQIPFPLPIPWPWPRRRRGPFTGSNLTMNMNAAANQQWPQRGGYRDFMEDITTAGGGPVYDAERISDLSRLASRIAEELRHVYMLSYYPTNSLTNGGYREIRIRVRGRSEIAVRHRRGYNAQELGRRSGT